MTWKRILKAPPIDNPIQEETLYPNDDLPDLMIERLFEEQIDPQIERAASAKSDMITINPKEIGINKELLLEKVKQFYGDKGYHNIRFYGSSWVAIFLLPED
jgi:hypothetical protein